MIVLVTDIPSIPFIGLSCNEPEKHPFLGAQFDFAWHSLLPIICLTYGGLAALSRYARSGMIEVVRQDYIRTARAKGLTEKVVIFKHALRNGMIPIITLLANLLPVLIGGSVIIEFIFSIDGMGQLGYLAVVERDYNVVMAVATLSAVMTLIGILLSDIAYVIVDPRISFESVSE
jgi:peptide/nickel transport system permease protein